MKLSTLSLYVACAFACSGPLLQTASADDVANAPAADNSKMNQSERPDQRLTAEQQGNSKSDVEMTRSIRQGLVKDKSLSTDAHNVKIITRNGKVTMKGPVRSDEEKAKVDQIAKEHAGAGNVMDHLTVASK